MQVAAEAAIAASDVWKRYAGRRGVQALAGVTLNVGRGEIFGLLGRNGAGKTTLVKSLLDLVRPDRGTTTLLGVSSSETRARQPVGYLPEDHRFPGYRTGLQTLHYYAALSGVDTPARDAAIPGLLDLVDLRGAAGAKVRTYSKGMKQRLGLAQALVHDPDVVFLDEPTDGVDPVGRAVIRTALIELRGRGKTIFINSHLLGEVEQVCDRVAIMELGKVVREGTVEDLTRTDGVYELATAPGLDDEGFAALSALVADLRRTAGGLEFRVDEEHELDRVVDHLRGAGIGLRRLAGRSATLEDVFLSSVEAREGAS